MLRSKPSLFPTGPEQSREYLLPFFLLPRPRNHRTRQPARQYHRNTQDPHRERWRWRDIPATLQKVQPPTLPNTHLSTSRRTLERRPPSRLYHHHPMLIASPISKQHRVLRRRSDALIRRRHHHHHLTQSATATLLPRHHPARKVARGSMGHVLLPSLRPRLRQRTSMFDELDRRLRDYRHTLDQPMSTDIRFQQGARVVTSSNIDACAAYYGRASCSWYYWHFF